MHRRAASAAEFDETDLNMTQAAGIEFINVTKAYGAKGESVAVRGISFSVAAGNADDAARAVRLRQDDDAADDRGLEAPTSGTIQIGGRDVTLLPPSERNVSLVFQSYALFPHMRVLDNVATAWSSADAEGGAQQRAESDAGRRRADRPVAPLAVGTLRRQQQRVAVARALILEPSVLLFDEPLSNLDARLRRQMREEIRALQQRLKLTVVYVTHDQSEALAVSDKIIVMNQGIIAQMGAPRELYEAPASRFIAGFIGEANLIDGTLTRTDKSRSAAGDPVAAHRPRAGPIIVAVRPKRGGSAMRATRRSGKVVKAAYLGGYCEYTIAVPQGDQFVVSPDVRTLRARRRHGGVDLRQHRDRDHPRD
jgi:iron(III) transport system ATP-binding protein